MWYKILTILLISFSLTACDTQEEGPPDTTSSLCAMLKPKVSSDNYKETDLATMKRKNPTDQAKLMNEYNSYSCPEILDQAPPPNYTPK